MLLAVKWIGNVGSHNNLDSILEEDLFAAFDIMEHLIDRLFVKREDLLEKLAEDINIRKGKPTF